jgi:hypothetical protein
MNDSLAFQFEPVADLSLPFVPAAAAVRSAEPPRAPRPHLLTSTTDVSAAMPIQVDLPPEADGRQR